MLLYLHCLRAALLLVLLCCARLLLLESAEQTKNSKEDKHLCESWLEVSLDGAQSNEQHRYTY
jgi:hypothetical protein